MKPNDSFPKKQWPLLPSKLLQEQVMKCSAP